jgi:hypothetical protein
LSSIVRRSDGEVKGLVDPRMKVEIEAQAVVG